MTKRRTRSEAAKGSSSEVNQQLKDIAREKDLPSLSEARLKVGTQVKFASGREHFQPIKFHGFDIGPFEITITIDQGSPPLEALQKRARSLLQAMKEEEFKFEREAYLQRVKDLDEFMEEYANR